MKKRIFGLFLVLALACSSLVSCEVDEGEMNDTYDFNGNLRSNLREVTEMLFSTYYQDAVGDLAKAWYEGKLPWEVGGSSKPYDYYTTFVRTGTDSWEIIYVNTFLNNVRMSMDVSRSDSDVAPYGHWTVSNLSIDYTEDYDGEIRRAKMYICNDLAGNLSGEPVVENDWAFSASGTRMSYYLVSSGYFILEAYNAPEISDEPDAVFRMGFIDNVETDTRLSVN